MNTMEKISRETMIFMRGNYCLDEIGDGKDELKFKQGQKTIFEAGRCLFQVWASL